MIEEALRRQLEPVVDRRRRLALAGRLALYWLACALAGLALIGMDRLFGWRWPPAVGILCAVVALATVWAVYRSRRLRPDYQAIARNIEQQHPDVKALLLAAIEQRPQDAEGNYGYLQKQVLLQAISHATDHDWVETISARKLALANAGWFAALCFLLAVLSLAWPSRQGGSAAGMGLFGGGYNITVAPGDTEVEKGSPVVILARFEGQEPSEVSLLFGPAGETPERMTLTKSLDDPVFGGIIQNVSDDLVYRVEYADRSTRDYTISIYERPELVRADAKITYPAYTKLPEKVVEDTRQISVVEGSEVTLTFTLNKPVTTARLTPKSGIAPALAIDGTYPNVLTTSITATQSQQFELQMADAQGRSNKLPPRFVIDVQKNLPPVLTPAFPAGDVVVSPLEEMTLEAKVADDYGLVGYGVTYTLVGAKSRDINLSAAAQPLSAGSTRVEGVPPSDRGPEARDTQDANVAQPSSPGLTPGGGGATLKQSPQVHYLLALEDLKAEPDQLLTYYFWAEDIGPDGKPRRVASDMYFAEVRPFEEIFRESQSFQDQQNQQQQEQNQGEGQQNQSADQLARLQKQILVATWNIKQQADRAGGMEGHKEDLDVVRQSQAEVLEQAKGAQGQAEDAASAKSLQAAAGHMQTSLDHLTKASEAASTTELTPALDAEQSAYQELLKLRQREHQVARGRNASRSNNANSQRMQQQLQQLELTQRENRYETQQLAQARQQNSQQQDLQMLNRLRDLARRQSEMSDKLREAEAALRQARNEQQRQDTLRQLQRLRDEQLQSLRDADEIGQQMDSSQNRQRMADARQRLDDSRANIRESAEALEQGMLSRAQTSATRAQRQLEQMREELQRQTSSRFANEMRDMRDQAQQLDQRQDEIARQIGQQLDARQKSLAGPDVSRELADQIGQQKENMQKLLEEMKQTSDQAEASEPLLSRKLYDTLRDASTGDTDKALEATGEMLRRNLLPQAQQIERRAGEGVNQLRQGIEEAARSVLGDEAESLRLARQQLDELIKQANGGNPRAQDAVQRRAGRDRQPADGQPRPQDANQATAQAGQQPQEGNQQAQARDSSNPQSGLSRSARNDMMRNQQSDRSDQARQGGSPRDGAQPQDAQGQRGQAQATDRQGDRQGQNGNRQGDLQARGGQRQGNPQDRTGDRQADRQGRGGERLTLDGNPGSQSADNWGNAELRGPFTDENYGPWSQRLRDLQEMLPQQDLREQTARIWDSVRSIRADSKRHGNEPQWDLVQNQVIGPLVELRQRVSERLAQLQSDQALVPIDRDPVPDRFTDLVRTYFDNLGQGVQ